MKKPNLVRSAELVVRMNELGYDISVSAVYHNFPYAYYNRMGLSVDGEIEHSCLYDAKQIEKILKETGECKVIDKLRERGHIVDPAWEKFFPREYDKENDKYYFDIDIIEDFVTNVNLCNFRDKLRELGYELDDDKYDELTYECRDYQMKGFSGYSLEKAVRLLNCNSYVNLKDRIEEMGFRVNKKLLRKLKFSFNQYVDGIEIYDLVQMELYLKKHNLDNLFTDMKKYINDLETNGNDISFYQLGEDIQTMYKETGNFTGARFPITKWYTSRYNEIPDICIIGSVYINDILSNKDYTVRWYFKHYSEFKGDPTSEKRLDMLRYIEDANRMEFISEALMEIEEGMFLHINDGRYDVKKDSLYANVCIYYKEGIHDPTDLQRDLCDRFMVHDETGTLGLLFHNNSGFNTRDFLIPEPEIDFDLNYNEGFEKVHETILTELSKQESRGLVLLHGQPGTGKTTYIRYLINQIGKNKIFIPPNLAEMLSDPGFIPFLLGNTNSVLFVEDAEIVLKARDDGNNNQAVSNILNITDGLLSDCLNIQIVASFNTDLKNIDSALLRKGRLIALYEFDVLASDRAEKLADSLKVWLNDTDNLTLADIYSAAALNNMT